MSSMVSNVSSSNKYEIIDSASPKIDSGKRCGVCCSKPIKQKWSLVHNGHYVGHEDCIKEWIKSSGNLNCLICQQAMDPNSVFSWKERKLLQVKSCEATVLKWMPKVFILTTSAKLALALAPIPAPINSFGMVELIAGGLGVGLGSFLGVSLVRQVTGRSMKVVDFLLKKSLRVQPELATEERDARIRKWMTYGLRAGALNGAVCTTVAGITMLKLACLIQDVSPWAAPLCLANAALGMLTLGGLEAYDILTADVEMMPINRPEDAFL